MLFYGPFCPSLFDFANSRRPEKKTHPMYGYDVFQFILSHTRKNVVLIFYVFISVYFCFEFFRALFNTFESATWLNGLLRRIVCLRFLLWYCVPIFLIFFLAQFVNIAAPRRFKTRRSHRPPFSTVRFSFAPIYTCARDVGLPTVFRNLSTA